MPSVGSTPTTTSPAAQQHPLTMTQQHPKLQQQHSLPLQLQYYHHPQVTTTQPSPAGTFINQAGIISTTGSSIGMGLSNGGDISPLSSSNSFSSVDTNQTLLNSIANQNHTHQHQHQHQLPTLNASMSNNSRGSVCNRLYCTKYSQFMIITPAVSIDRDVEQNHMNGGGKCTATKSVPAASADNNDDDDDDPYFNNGNIFRMSLLQSSIDSGNSSDSSFRSNFNPYLSTSRQHLLPKTTSHFYTFPSWRWCTLICAAMRCFGGGRSSNAPYSSSFGRPPYHRSCSTSGYTTSSMPHHRLRSSSFTAETAFEHFSAPFKPRKTRDHMNNITYEL